MEGPESLVARISGLWTPIEAITGPGGLFVLAILVVLVLYGLSIGRTRSIVSLLAISVAYMLTALFPFLSWLRQSIPAADTIPYLGLAVFGVFYIFSLVLISHATAHHRLTLGETGVSKTLLVSLLQVGLLASISLSLLPATTGKSLAGPAYGYLAGQKALWVWAVASLALLPFVRVARRD